LSAFGSSLAFNRNNTPYISYAVGGFGGDKITVMKYDCPFPRPIIGICAAFTDTATGYNMIVWDGSTNANLDSYRVFREDNGDYVQIGSVAGTVNKFTDVTTTPSANSYKYKLTWLDNCERELDIDSSTLHKTIRLRFNYLFDGKVSIAWNRYE